MDEPIAKVSTFNEASLQMMRLNNLQAAMNEYRINPFSRTHSDFQWDFELWAACIDGLYLEVSPKLTKKKKETDQDKEDETATKLLKISRDKIIQLLKVTDTSLWGHLVHRKKMWEIKEALFESEKYIRLMMDEHGLGTPNAENTTGDPYA